MEQTFFSPGQFQVQVGKEKEQNGGEPTGACNHTHGLWRLGAFPQKGLEGGNHQGMTRFQGKSPERLEREGPPAMFLRENQSPSSL